ncbi:hypothetical protein PaecuDRAFT_1838 [Paenibacillus curdlanolyticus YK9]|uniref:Uncharacterized protein n=1 Tax=Paenibacillus curdlanolyticus YK9 TaxID=717606 RepID=E0I887_9BACL|nr:hypothetical protein [Paenibacillus curdlanolyticus]EFM11392.1 hypothetical protein PaecuDRAFT_1838 [Paenibacillus curdlanolyticus YK9]
MKRLIELHEMKAEGELLSEVFPNFVEEIYRVKKTYKREMSIDQFTRAVNTVIDQAIQVHALDKERIRILVGIFDTYVDTYHLNGPDTALKFIHDIIGKDS